MQDLNGLAGFSCVGISGLFFAAAADDDLARALSKGFPVVVAIDSFDAEASGQEEKLEFAWEEDVHVQLA
jgi:hypothetical protein